MKTITSIPDFSKMNGLIPVIVQNASTARVLMLGFMNREAWEKTMDSGHVTFFSRTKNRLWTKGEESGNFLLVKEIFPDCDNDTLLITADPKGPTCHTGDISCFGNENPESLSFLGELQELVLNRKQELPEKSYTTSLFKSGINKIAQKVGEEAVELIIESKDQNKELFLGEAADLLYHYLVLLAAKDCSIGDVIDVLKKRHR
ncbi:MAG: bifunctional phosphoribosyl-AMP cyclohydrolase/phosphoribosyl-ATP diphosphatase HisIE [Bacteroidales bacterium]